MALPTDFEFVLASNDHGPLFCYMEEDLSAWATVKGIDSDGSLILANLKRLQAGELDADQICELL